MTVDFLKVLISINSHQNFIEGTLRCTENAMFVKGFNPNYLRVGLLEPTQVEILLELLSVRQRVN